MRPYSFEDAKSVKDKGTGGKKKGGSSKQVEKTAKKLLK